MSENAGEKSFTKKVKPDKNEGSLVKNGFKSLEFTVDEKNLMENMSLNCRAFERQSKSCSDLSTIDGKTEFHKITKMNSNNLLDELDRQYENSTKPLDLNAEKRNTWPNILKSIEMRKRLTRIIPENFRKGFSIFLADDGFTVPISLDTDENQSKFKAFLNSNWCLCVISPTLMLITLVVVAYFSSSYMKSLMVWIESQNSGLIFAILFALYILMCFPLSLGFFFIKIVTGYLYGFFLGLTIAVLNSMVGVAISHYTIKALNNKCNCKQLIKNKTALAILRIINGPRAVRIIIFTRITPLPTGIQNLIFSFCKIKLYLYLLATFIGMVPSEMLTIYLGSGFRSMQDVIANKGNIWPTYIYVGSGVLFGVILTSWIAVKAKKELQLMIEEENCDANSV